MENNWNLDRQKGSGANVQRRRDYAAGGIATPADAALLMQTGMDGVFVGSGIFKSGNPAKRGEAIVKATSHFKDATILAEVSRNIGAPMVGGKSPASRSEN